MENQAQTLAQSSNQKEPFIDPVKAQGILNELCRKQKFAAKLWNEKWGFYTRTREVQEEEALKIGMSLEEYRSAVRTLSTAPKPANQYLARVAPSPIPMPPTTSGMYGHRAAAACALEKYGRLVKTPRTYPTRPPLPPEQVYDPYKQTMVFLGSVSGDPISYKLPPARREVTNEMWARPQHCPVAPLSQEALQYALSR